MTDYRTVEITNNTNHGVDIVIPKAEQSVSGVPHTESIGAGATRTLDGVDVESGAFKALVLTQQITANVVEQKQSTASAATAVTAATAADLTRKASNK